MKITFLDQMPEYLEGSALVEWFIQETKKPDSPSAKFLEMFTLEFVLENLSSKNQKIFLEKVTAGETSALDYACSQIPNFNEKYSEAVCERFVELFSRIGVCQGTQEKERLRVGFPFSENRNRKDW